MKRNDGLWRFACGDVSLCKETLRKTQIKYYKSLTKENMEINSEWQVTDNVTDICHIFSTGNIFG